MLFRSVEDTGIGIAPQDLERIFLPFERGSAGRRSTVPGTGLGLTITHLLTELMGGELSVQSVMGQGSTFSVRMYLREIACPPEHQVGSPAYRAERLLHRPITGYVGPRKTLLVVDDQPIQRQMLAGMLLPSATITCLLAALFVQIEQAPAVQAVLRGVIPATGGMDVYASVFKATTGCSMAGGSCCAHSMTKSPRPPSKLSNSSVLMALPTGWRDA